MSRRFAAGAAVVGWLFAPSMVRTANAQVLRVPVSPVSAVTFSANDNALVPVRLDVPFDATAPATPERPKPAPAAVVPAELGGGGSHTLLPLYASTALLQVLDIHSTFAALDRGAAEGNPVLKGLVSNRSAFIAVKAGLAASTILAISRMARHHRLAAILTAVGINAAYSFVVWHNYKLAASMR
jgi:Domain of unknown function (DUF5658)